MNTIINRPPSPNTRSIHSNGSTHTATSRNASAAGSSARYGAPDSSCHRSATPPISAAQVSRLTSAAATRVSSAALTPARSRMRLKTGRCFTAAMRPAISQYTMIPTVPSSVTHRSW